MTRTRVCALGRLVLAAQRWVAVDGGRGGAQQRPKRVGVGVPQPDAAEAVVARKAHLSAGSQAAASWRHESAGLRAHEVRSRRVTPTQVGGT